MCNFRRLTIPMIKSENCLFIVFQMFMIKKEKEKQQIEKKKSMNLKNKINRSVQGNGGMLIAYCSLMRDAHFASC